VLEAQLPLSFGLAARALSILHFDARLKDGASQLLVGLFEVIIWLIFDKLVARCMLLDKGINKLHFILLNNRAHKHTLLQG
jgi:hypothetical protein